MSLVDKAGIPMK